MKKKHWISILSFVLVLGIAAVVHACPWCKESVRSSDAIDPSGPPAAFNQSIYYMIGTFVTVLGVVIWNIVRAM